MNTRNAFLLLGGLAIAVVLIQKLSEKLQAGKIGEPSGETGHTPVVNIVAETLRQHEGEDNPIVHAFEEALEHDANAAHA